MHSSFLLTIVLASVYSHLMFTLMTTWLFQNLLLKSSRHLWKQLEDLYSTTHECKWYQMHSSSIQYHEEKVTGNTFPTTDKDSDFLRWKDATVAYLLAQGRMASDCIIFWVSEHCIARIQDSIRSRLEASSILRSGVSLSSPVYNSIWPQTQTFLLLMWSVELICYSVQERLLVA